ncbi:hypothetical protein BTJ40_18165 [Microbulbifer sp. A4B17]|nr:hypothetical protein BTJ40_18165 [Microbulbifer sp. A4B17]
MIALFTGARCGEIAQLRAEDVREQDGITYFSINDEEGKAVKSKAAIRKVCCGQLQPDTSLSTFLKFDRG